MKGSFLVRLSLCLLVFAALGTGGYLATRGQVEKFGIDPGRVRPWTEKWGELRDDRRAAPAWKVTEKEFFSGIQVEHDTAAGLLNIVAEPVATLPLYEHFGPGAPNAPLTLRAVGINGWLEKPDSEWAPDAQPPARPAIYIDAATLQPIAPLPNLPTASQGVNLDAQFSIDGDKPLHSLDDWMFFDGRTHALLGLKENWGSGGKSIRVGTQMRPVRSAHVTVAVDLTLGTAPIGELEARDGAGTAWDGRVIRIVHADTLDLPRAPYWYRKSPTRHTLHLRENPIESTAPFSNYLVAVYPDGYRSGLRFKALDKDGKPLKSSTYPLVGVGFFVRCQALPETVHRFALSGPERFIRQVTELPEIPGFPAENNTVTDMADLTIPYLRIKSQEDAISQLRWIAQVGVTGDTTPPGPKPPFQEFENIKVRDLIHVIRGQAAVGTKVIYHPTTCELEYKLREPPFWVRWFQDE